MTREAVFFDRTHLVLGRAAEVGEALALNKEKRILEVVLGLTNNYRFNGSAYSTYYDGSGDDDPWCNVLADNALEDWTNIDAAENRLASILDPSSGEPVLTEPDTVLVMPPRRHIASRLFYASELSYSDTPNTSVSAVPNPFAKYKLVSSRIAMQLLADAQPAPSGNDEPADVGLTWFIGNFARAFAYMENWPITVARSTGGSEADFTRDIVVRFKASERGTPAVLNPRYVVKCTGE